MMTLYFTPNTCALASLITLEEIGTGFKLERISFPKEEQKSARFLKVNPKARVPALETDHGILTETPAILAYLAQTHPDSNLAPASDPFRFARMQEFNSYLCSTLHVAHAHRMRGHRWVDDAAAIEAMQRKVPQSVGESFAYVEQQALAGPYVLGDQYSVADAYLFTLSRWMKNDGLNPADYPKVPAHSALVGARPAVIKAVQTEGDAS